MQGTGPAIVTVIGGASVDVKARSTAPAVAATSNPGTTTLTSGGVGRNVAENLARLGTPVRLVAAVGHDQLGDRLVTDTAAAGVDVDAVLRSTQPTGSYTAVLDVDGELMVAVADMAATDTITPDTVQGAAPLVASAGLLVLDGNLPTESVRTALALARTSGVPVVLDPVSVPKAARLAPVLESGVELFLVTPNVAELDALGGGVGRLHGLGVEHVWVRHGAEGSLLSSRSGAEPVHLAAVPGVVLDVTGAGDAMLAAFCHGVLTGMSPVEAARFGHAAAAVTVAVPHTVRPDLSRALVEEALRSAS
jgi:pseudouridine kinase